MSHTTLISQPLEKGNKKHHDYNNICKKFGTTPGSTKSSPTASKASPTSVPDRLTMQEIINASLSQHAKNICPIRHTLERILCREKHTL